MNSSYMDRNTTAWSVQQAQFIDGQRVRDTLNSIESKASTIYGQKYYSLAIESTARTVYISAGTVYIWTKIL